MKRTKRMNKPEDKLIKRSNAFLGDIMHAYHKLPGQYKRSITNQYIDTEGKEMKTDGSYLVELEKQVEESEEYNRKTYIVNLNDDEMKRIIKFDCKKANTNEMIINIEDESSGVNERPLAKAFKYALTLHYAYGIPVYTVFTTPVSREKCLSCYNSGNVMIIPKIISYSDMDGGGKLKEYGEKVHKDEYFSNVEGYGLIIVPRMFGERGSEVLEEVVDLFAKMKMKDPNVRYHLAKCLECIINKYAKTLDDINRLEEMMDMEKITNLREQYIQNIRNEEREEGREEGKINLARKFIEKYGIDEVAKISGIDKELLKN